MAITYKNIAGEESATVTFRVATVEIARGSTNEQQEILTIGDPQSSLGMARVVASAPASTEMGLVVRIASGPSSAVDLVVRPAFSSTSADNPVQISGNSTVVQGTNPWVVSGNVRATWSSTLADNLAVVYQSTAGDLVMRPVFSSTNTDNPVRAVLSSTAADNPVTVSGYVAPSTQVEVTNQVRVRNSTATDLLVRPVFSSTSTDNPVVLGTQTPWDSTYVSGEKGSSGDTTLLSGAASTRFAVFAYQLTVDSTTPTLVRILSGSTSEMARWQFRAPSSGSMGAVQSVPMPAYLYRTAAGSALVLHTDSTATVHYAFHAFRMS